MPRHLSHLNEGKSNASFAADIKQEGLDNFEIIIIKDGVAWEDQQKRLELERRVQTVLRPLGLCYNTGTTETSSPRPAGQYSTSCGLYCIRNKINNTCYFGETAQRRGLSQRLSNWKNRLNKKDSTNQKLLADWIEYGADAFEFFVVTEGPQWVDEATRKTEEEKLIQAHLAKGYLVYNKIRIKTKL